MNPQTAKWILAILTVVIFVSVLIITISSVKITDDIFTSMMTPWILGGSFLFLCSFGGYISVTGHIRTIDKNQAVISRSTGEILYYNSRSTGEILYYNKVKIYVWAKQMADLYFIALTDTLNITLRPFKKNPAIKCHISIKTDFADRDRLVNFLNKTRGHQLQYVHDQHQAIMDIVIDEFNGLDQADCEDLRSLNDPADPNQQKKFTDFINQILEPKIIPYGLMITTSSFNLA